MACALRFLLISMALWATTAGTASASKGNPPAHKPPVPKPPPIHKPPLPKPVVPKMPLPKPPPPPRLPVPHQTHGVPRHVSPPRVSHHARPIVYRALVRHRHPTATRIVRQPVRHTAIRTIHRYPVHRVPFRFVRRHYYYGGYGFYRAYGYGNYGYRGRYWWGTNYNRRHGAWHRRGPRVIGGIVESVQGVPGSGILVVRTFRPSSSRFRWARRAAGPATSLRSFLLNNGTFFEVIATPLRVGTIADLHKGAHVLVLPYTHTANLAQKVRLAPFRR